MKGKKQQKIEQLERELQVYYGYLDKGTELLNKRLVATAESLLKCADRAPAQEAEMYARAVATLLGARGDIW